MKAMFLDESGDHSLTVIDPEYPVFVLGGIITKLEYAENEMSGAVRRFKRDVGLSDDILCIRLTSRGTATGSSA